MKTMTRATGLALALALLPALAACGDDDDNTTSAPAGTRAPAAPADTAAAAPAPAGDGAGASALGAQFCRSLLDLDIAATPVDFEDPAELAAAVPTLQPLVEALGAYAPAALATEVSTVQDAFAQAVAGNGDALESSSPAIDTIELGAFDGCGFQQVALTAEDFHFQGMPARLQPGETSFKLTNAGQQPHVVVIVRKKAGVTESFDQILAKAAEGGPEAVGPYVEDVAAGAFTLPGSSSAITADLTPGQYLLLCPIPVQGANGEEGPPHFTQGMIHEFSVA